MCYILCITTQKLLALLRETQLRCPELRQARGLRGKWNLSPNLVQSASTRARKTTITVRSEVNRKRRDAADCRAASDGDQKRRWRQLQYCCSSVRTTCSVLGSASLTPPPAASTSQAVIRATSDDLFQGFTYCVSVRCNVYNTRPISTSEAFLCGKVSTF